MHTGQTGGGHQLRDMRLALATTLALLLWRENLARADLVEDVARELGDTAGQLAALVLEESAVVRIRSVLRDARELEGFGVVPAGVAAAMADDDRMVARHFVEVAARQRDVELGVVEHDRTHPLPGRR